MILHIPHASILIPANVRDQFQLSDAELAAEIIRLTDSYTDELFTCQGASRIVSQVSRLVVDPERFLDDDQEPMYFVGMGVLYTNTSYGTLLRHRLSDTERQRLIDKYYFPHHTQLTLTVEEGLATDHRCLIIDCHSFPSIPLSCEYDKSTDRPDICIGTDKYHTPEWLSQALDGILKGQGYTTKFNSPYLGTIVPLKYYQKEPNVHSIMIEINRSLYMDEKTGTKINAFRETCYKMSTILSSLGQIYLNSNVNTVK